VYSALVEKVPQWFWDFMTLVGVEKDRVLVLDKTVRFRNVIVPDAACCNEVVSNQWTQTFQGMAQFAESDKSYDKVYLSRMALEKRRTFGELQVQKIFEKNGFYILCPEKYTLLQQVGIMKNARVLAGCAGTALHLALFMKPGGRVVQIKRNSMIDDNLASQYLIDSMSGLDTDVIWASVEEEATEHFSSAPQIIAVNDYMKEFFAKNNFVFSDKDLFSEYTEEKDYCEQLQQYKTKWGSVRANKIRNRIIKYSACLIPNRKLRGKYRAYMKARFVAR
jgi:capsular polysaccharide biosynthesis protein